MDTVEKLEQVQVTDVAIIGMAGRFPGAKDIDTFWQNLRNGVESITTFSDREMLAVGVPPELLSNPNYIKVCGVLDGIDLFDAHFFHYSPAEASLMDPQQRIFLECAYHALEHAGYDTWRYNGRIGVYAGSSLNTYFLFNVLPNFDFYTDASRVVIGNEKDFLTTRVSYQLNLRGPSFSLQAGCSTSLFAIHLGYQSLVNGECDMALVGGVSVVPPQENGFLYREGGVWTADGHCRAFDARATGALPGNGVGIVVLKRLEDALADGDSVYAVMKGSAVSNDGHMKMSFASPSIHGEMAAIAEAQAMAEVKPETITYIEAHGTGTPLGDPIEIESLTQVFRASTAKKQFCAIGSVKTNIGHLDTAAGVASMIKTVLALKQKEIPPSLHFEQPNPQIDFPNSPFYVNTTLSPWHAEHMPRRAGISSFGVGGTNAHLVLEEAPAMRPAAPSRPWQLLLLSARTATALEAQSQLLAAHLEAHPEQSLADVAYTLQVGRRQFVQRRAVICRDHAEASAALLSGDTDRVFTAKQEMQERAVIFLFPGQGSQYIHMARELYVTEPLVRQVIDQCADHLMSCLQMDVRQLLYPTREMEAEAGQRINQVRYSQVVLFVLEYALARLWMSWGIQPKAMIGHSLGEYVAACLAGVFSLEDALLLVAARGHLMQSQPEGAMLAIALPEAFVRVLIDPPLCLAAVNGPSHCVVSGPAEAVERLQQRLATHSVEHRRLKISHAGHSAMMDGAINPLVEHVQQIQRNAPQIPYISNVTGSWVRAEEATDPLYWGRHLRQPVRFLDGMQTVLSLDQQCVLLEVGPGRTLSTFARLHPAKGAGHMVLQSVRHPQEEQSDEAFLLTTLGKLWLAGVSIEWKNFYAQERRYRVPLPAYPFERQRYWIDGPADAARGPLRAMTQTEHGSRSAIPVTPPVEMSAPVSAPAASIPQGGAPARNGANGQGRNTTIATPRPELLNRYEAPVSDTERRVAAIWQRFLGIEPIGVHDNFYELGGHSMMALQINTELRESFAVELPLRSFLVEAPTVARLGSAIDLLLSQKETPDATYTG